MIFLAELGGGRGANSKTHKICVFFWKLLDFIAQKWCSNVVPEQVILDARLRIPVFLAFRPAVNILLVCFFPA